MFWLDRANVATFDPLTGNRTPIDPDSGRLYNASGSGSLCVTADQNGWAGRRMTWLPSTWSPAALGAPGLAGDTIQLDVGFATDDGNWDGSNRLGFRFDQVTVTDLDLLVPDTRSNVCTPCAATLPLPEDQWWMVSLACDASTVDEVFGDDLDGAYNDTWVVFEWDPEGKAYNKLQLGSHMDQGRGYAIKTVEVGKEGTVAGLETDPVCDPSSSLNECFEIGIKGAAEGLQNLLGHPYQGTVNWKDVLVADSTGTEHSLDAAANTFGILSATMHKWNGAAYQAFDGGTPGFEGTLDEGDGFWVKGFDATATLRIPVPGAAAVSEVGSALSRVPPGPESTKKAKKSKEWWVRIVASSGDLVDPGNALGQLDDSVDGWDSHDLRELEPFGAPYLTVVFPHSDWGEIAGNTFTTDFHGIEGSDSWSFEVRSDDDARQVSLSFEGSEKILNRSRLIDEATGEKIKVDGGGDYTFVMNGVSRSFTFALSRGDGEDDKD